MTVIQDMRRPREDLRDGQQYSGWLLALVYGVASFPLLVMMLYGYVAIQRFFS